MWRDLGQGGRSVLWRDALVSAGRVRRSGLDVPDRTIPQAFRRRGGSLPTLSIDLPWPRFPLAAPELRLARACVYFHEPQRVPPRAVLALTIRRSAGAPGRLERAAIAHGSGQEWWIEAAWPDGAGEGNLTALHIAMQGFAGERFNVGDLELLGPSELRAGSFVRLTQGHDTRLVRVAGAGDTPQFRVSVSSGARLFGEVAQAPPGAAGPIAASVRVSGGGKVLGQACALDPGGTFASYEIPLDAVAGGTVDVHLSSSSTPGSLVLWAEPVILPPPSTQPAQVVLVSLDTLREDAVFPPAGSEPSMPRLRARARREGQIVRHHYAASSWTLPSHASMLSGLYPTAHGAMAPRAAQDFDLARYLPAQLARSGFFTAGHSDGGFLSPVYGFSAGFDRYLDSGEASWRLANMEQGYDALRARLAASDSFLFLHTLFVHDYFMTREANVAAPDLPPDLAAFLAERPQPLIDQIAKLLDDHSVPQDPRLPRLLGALYAWRAGLLDEWLDHFLDTLARHFPGAPPLVVITSDHGERFGEEPDGTWHHGRRTDERVLRVPLVIFHRDRQRRRDVEDLTSGVDLAPTLLRLAGVPERTGGPGVDLLDADALRVRKEVFSENYSGGDAYWTLVDRQRMLIANTRLLPGRLRRDEWRLFSGRPLAWIERPAAEGAMNRLAIALRRREELCSDVVGSFVEVVNAGSLPASVELALEIERDAARQFRDDYFGERAVQAHLLEPEDRAELAAPPAPARFRLGLPPGDRDLLVVTNLARGAARLRVGPHDEPTALVVSGRAIDTTAVVPLGVGELPLQAPPLPAIDGSRVVIRVWSNPGRGSAAARATRAIPEELRQRLRAVGYVN